jgi:hypothetical protein
MAGKKPSFITGATAKIKLNDVTMAYAQDVSYNVTVTTIPIETMGRYEVVSNEPVAYFVDGTLSIIRYTSAAGQQYGTDQSNDLGNASNKWGTGAGAHFNPGQLIGSETFDMEIFSKFSGEDLGTLDAQGNKITTDDKSITKLIDCRFTRKGGAINKRGVLVEQYAFNAII